MSTPPAPPRIHVLFASEAPFGLIVLRLSRRKGIFYTCTIGWNRTNDTFELGQCLKAKIYEHPCDLSPDGKHFLYFVANYAGSWRQEGSTPCKIWTAVSRSPYLKALVFSGQISTHGGGGHFEDNTHFWLNGKESEQPGVAEGLNMIAQPSAPWPWGVNDVELYDLRMRRTGWQARDLASDQGYVCLWEKKWKTWVLRQFSHYYSHSKPPSGRGPFWQWYQAQDLATGETLGDESWEWANFDGDRLVWARAGKLFAAQIRNDGRGDVTELADFNDWKFKALRAPY